MPSFDIMSEVDKQEVKNAVEQVNKEVTNRFDFKGSDARVEQADYVLTLFADDDFKLDQVQEVLNAKLIKRGVDIKCMEIGKSEKSQRQQSKAHRHHQNRRRIRPGQKDRQTTQRQQDESPSQHSRRYRARLRCEARRAARRDCAG